MNNVAVDQGRVIVTVCVEVANKGGSENGAKVAAAKTINAYNTT